MKGLTFNETRMKAWLEGRMTVMRRLIKPQPVQPTLEGWKMNPCLLETGEWGWYLDGEIDGPFIKPPYRPGETVYIKETWMGTKDCLSYKASDPRQIIEFNYDRWQSPLCMPEWASRGHALIVSMRPERVQEINGVFHDEILKEGWPFPGIFTESPYKDFSILWESLHPGSWERNDWVWRIELKKREGK